MDQVIKKTGVNRSGPEINFLWFPWQKRVWDWQ